MEKTWEDVKEEDGILRVPVQRRVRRRDENRITSSIRRGLIRYLYVALDLSDSMKETDLKPTRGALAKKELMTFIDRFFDENPLSQMGVLVTQNRQVNELSTVGGEATLQATLEMAIACLRSAPDYGQRELLILYGSIMSCDAGDIFEAIAGAKRSKLRVSVICLAAEVYICKRVAEETGGTFAVARSEPHLHELLEKQLQPPPRTAGTAEDEGDFFMVGFPERKLDQQPFFLLDGRDVCLSSVAHECPQCKALVADLPSRCPVCALQLNSSAHIARSYHHLFPVPAWEDVGPPDAPAATPAAPAEASAAGGGCFACLRALSAGGGCYRCPACRELFCGECEAYVHDVLHNCPGCLGRHGPAAAAEDAQGPGGAAADA